MIKRILGGLLLVCCSLNLSAQTMVLYSPDPTPPGLPPVTFVATFTGLLIYNGGSRIDSRGITYYQETVPAAATIAVEIQSSLATSTIFNLSASQGGLTYSFSGPLQAGNNFYTLSPNNYTPNNFNDVGTRNLLLTHSQIQGSVTLQPRIDVKSLPAGLTTVVPIVVGGHTWMDRPLGAHRRATHVYNDPLARASLFQWGRPDDGHEVWISDGDNPNTRVPFNNFINQQQTTPVDARVILNYNTLGGRFSTGNSATDTEWSATYFQNLWVGGVSAVNNPCPSGYRLPTTDELQDLFNAAAPLNGGFDEHQASSGQPFISAHGDIVSGDLIQVSSPIPKPKTTDLVSLYAVISSPATDEVNDINSVVFQSFRSTDNGTTGFTARFHPIWAVRCILD